MNAGKTENRSVVAVRLHFMPKKLICFVQRKKNIVFVCVIEKKLKIIFLEEKNPVFLR